MPPEPQARPLPEGPVDLDAQATSPLRPEALAAMLPWLERNHWNPHSVHRGGRLAKAALEAAREAVAARLGRPASGLIFTSGATESNNLALKGVMERHPGRRLVSFATEHSCVLESARHLEALGTPVTILPVRADGMPDRAAYAGAIGRGDVALVSAMRVNNEVGSIWPVADMAAEARAAGALFHCDAAQAFGKVDLEGDIDLMSLSAHKIGGPKGIGALWVRPGLRLVPLLDGGGQEANLRSGTQSPALAAGFGAAAAAADAAAAHAAARRLMDVAIAALAAIPHRVNGPDPQGGLRWPGNLSVCFPGLDASRLISALPGIALSSGSACSSGSGRPSHVLAALGLSTQQARQTLRLGWQPGMPADMLQDALGQLVETVKRLRP